MIRRRALLAGLAATALVPATGRAASGGLADVLEAAGALERLHTLIVAHRGEVLAEAGFRGHATDRPTNIKSASKSVIGALVGIAIARGLIADVGQTLASLLPDDLPANPDPRLAQVSVENLLSMQAGLTPQSGAAYGRWVASRNWVRAALAADFVADPGTGWQYSTASTHLLSAILTRVAGKPTRALAREWLAQVEGFSILDWSRDPQGIDLGGNEMAMTPRSLYAFGELFRRGGRAANGAVIVPEDWIAKSWTEHARSSRTGDAYGYCWFLRDIAGIPARFAWGFGGQMCYVLPQAELVVVMTSEQTGDAPESGYLDRLHALVAQTLSALA